MINPKLKGALERWRDAEKGCTEAECWMASLAYVNANSHRISALEEIRKIVDTGEFEAADPTVDCDTKLSECGD